MVETQTSVFSSATAADIQLRGSTQAKPSRKDQILQALAAMLEDQPGHRITTAQLAKRVGVSEAALYRHFPSKAKMFEGLIEFIESAVFSRTTLILNEPISCQDKCEHMMILLLTFAEKNPGITRILNGDALIGETDRLRTRIDLLFERLETQLRQLLREAEFRDGMRIAPSIQSAAHMILALAEGRISQFVRSNFGKLPTRDFDDHWNILVKGVFIPRLQTP